MAHNARNRLGIENAEQLDLLLADHFFGDNIPLSVVESKFFKKFCYALNSNYRLPTRKTLSTTILERRHKIFIEHTKRDVRTSGVLLIDGWKNKNANTKNVVSMMRFSNKYNVFLDAWDFSTTSENAQNLNAVTDHSVLIARTEYNINLYALVTDNASNMTAMGRRNDLWNLTCNSHSANLLCEPIIDENFAKSVQALIKEFKSPNLEKLLLNEGGTRLSLAAETRWCSHRDSFRKLKKNLPYMKIICERGHDIKPENRTLLDSHDFSNQLQCKIDMLDPICKLIRTCESLKCDVGYATELWLRLEVPIVDPTLINERIEKALNVYGLAANLLHPKFRGMRFVHHERRVNEVNSFIRQELTQNHITQLDDYSNQTGDFTWIWARNDQDWQVFWKIASPFYPELSELAIKLLSIPASTGQLERLFSQWAHVHNHKRNRLKPHRSAKLARLYYGLRCKNEVNFESGSDTDSNTE